MSTDVVTEQLHVDVIVSEVGTDPSMLMFYVILEHDGKLWTDRFGSVEAAQIFLNGTTAGFNISGKFVSTPHVPKEITKPLRCKFCQTTMVSYVRTSRYGAQTALCEMHKVNETSGGGATILLADWLATQRHAMRYYFDRAALERHAPEFVY